MFTVAYAGNKAPHFAFKMQFSYKMQKDNETDFRILRFMGARVFVHFERCTKKIALKAIEGWRVGYSSDGKSYPVSNPVTRRIIKRRDVIFIETPSRLLPPRSGEHFSL